MLCGLIVAAGKTPSTEVIQWLVDSGADVNATFWGIQYGSESMTPLMSAAGNKSDNALEIVKLLIKEGADVNNATTSYGLEPTPLTEAASNSGDNALEIVKLLINEGAVINATTGILLGGSWDMTPLMAAAAANSGNDALEIVKLLIKEGADVNATDDYNKTALDLMDPDDENNTEKIKVLKQHKGRYIYNSKLLNAEWVANATPEKLTEEIENGANVNDFKDEGLTPLMIFAEFNNNSECLKILLEHGVDVNAQEIIIPIGYSIYNRRKKGHTALMKASKSGLIDNMSLLLKKGADQFCHTSDGESALSFASNIDSVILLLECGLDVNETTARGITVLMSFSGRENCPESLRILIDKYGAEINSISNYGGTALMQASKNGHIDNVILLLEKGADKSVRTPKGETALSFAKEYGYFEVFKKLSENEMLKSSNEAIQSGSLKNQDEEINKALNEIYNADYWRNENSTSILKAIPYIDEFNETSGGWSILMLASSNISDPLIIFDLVSKGADINYKNNESIYGETVLMAACANNQNSKVIEALMSLGADVNEINKTGNNALMLAIEYNSNSDIIIPLADEIEDLNIQNNDGKTALILAIENNISYSEINFLINKDADVGIKNNNGETALDIAKQLNVSKDIMLLLDPDFKKTNDKIEQSKGKVSFVTEDLDRHFPRKVHDVVLLKNFGSYFLKIAILKNGLKIMRLSKFNMRITGYVDLLRQYYQRIYFMNESTKINCNYAKLFVKTGYKRFKNKDNYRGFNITHEWIAKEREYINNLTEILDIPEQNISFKLSDKKEHDRYLKIFAKENEKYYRIAIGQGLSEFKIDDKEINHTTPKYDFENSKLIIEIKKMKFVVYAKNKEHSLSVELRERESGCFWYK